MAKFKSDKYPALLVVGAGQFKDGELEVADQGAAQKVRAVAHRFDITEDKARSRKKQADSPESEPDS